MQSVLMCLLFPCDRTIAEQQKTAPPSSPREPRIKLRDIDFGNLNHLQLLTQMGITFHFQDGGKVMLAHDAQKVWGRERGELMGVLQIQSYAWGAVHMFFFCEKLLAWLVLLASPTKVSTNMFALNCVLSVASNCTIGSNLLLSICECIT